ncbi:MAG: ABC transporter permease, partial [Muribaculaceae bacterium]|nr:ABC transporter permease [Muribaculaceae bacterium]
SYIIKDVMETPSPDDMILHRISEVMITDDHIPETDHVACYFILHEGFSKETLTNELKELFPNEEVKLENAKDIYSHETGDIIRSSIILFMFLFVLVSFSNYLRQQTQLFRLREREVALRTCIGSQPSSLFALFSTEIMIILGFTLLLTLALISMSTGFINSRYEKVFESYDNYFNSAIPVALISTAILIAISLVCVAFTVRRIRMDQTGLALRMKPIPKHRIRNVGLTLQMTVSIFFVWATVIFFMSIQGFKKQYGIPEETERYRKCLQVRVNGITDDKSKEIFDKIESLQSLPSIEKIYKFIEYRSSLPLDQETKDYIPYSEVYQDGEDWIDFFNLERE